jgi:hypothetical protein
MFYANFNYGGHCWLGDFLVKELDKRVIFKEVQGDEKV